MKKPGAWAGSRALQCLPQGEESVAPPCRSVGSESGIQPPRALTCRVFLQVELKSQEAQSLQEQRDQYASHLQQYAVTCQQHVAAYQQLASEKEGLHKQVLLHTQLLDQLQHQEVQGKVAVEMARQELQETQVRRKSVLGPCLGDLQPVSLSHSFLGPLGAPGSCQPAEPAAAGPTEPLGYAWGR